MDNWLKIFIDEYKSEWDFARSWKLPDKIYLPVGNADPEEVRKMLGLNTKDKGVKG